MLIPSAMFLMRIRELDPGFNPALEKEFIKTKTLMEGLFFFKGGVLFAKKHILVYKISIEL